MARERRLGVAFSVAVAAIVVACSASRSGEEDLGSAGLELAADASDSPHDAREETVDAAACRSVTLRAHHERHEEEDHAGDGQAEVSLSPPMAFAIPHAIALTEHNPHARHIVELSFEPAVRHGREDGGEIVCTYASGPHYPAAQATFLSCSDGTHAGDVVTAREVDLGVEHDGEATATVTIDEQSPCGADAGTDAGRDAAADAGADAGRDAAADAGVDAGSDAAADAGVDAGVDGGDAGACTPASCDDANPCTTDTCGLQGCKHTAMTAGALCSDGNACNGLETCNGAGACQAGAPPICISSSPCLVDGCNPATGCTTAPAGAGASCSDGNACNGSEVCSAVGTCLAGSPPVIDDGNPCTVDACDAINGVTHVPASAGTSCSDGNACNGSETCDGAGACQVAAPLVCNSGSACIIDGCNPATGCTQAPAPVGVSCSDADACNGSETCDGAGGCAPGTPPVCNSHSACIVDACNPATGCKATPSAAGTSCSDGNACNGLETCDGAGACVAGTRSACNSHDPCIIDGCNGTTGCTTAPAPAGTSCGAANACNAAGTCDGAGTCNAGAGPALDDGNPCTADACDPVSGVTHTPVAAGTLCSDGNACNGAETCDASGACRPGTPLVCNSGNPCIADSCAPTTGCTQTAIPSCSPTPVQGENPFETRASLLGTVVSNTGAPITGATFTVYDEFVGGAPRSDVVVTAAADGSFRLRLSAFPDTESVRTPPRQVFVVIDAPGKIRAVREAYLHRGDARELGAIKLMSRDPAITMIGPSGGTATDSSGLVEVSIPAGALTTTVPVQITPFQNRDELPAVLPDGTVTTYAFEVEPSGTQFLVPITVRLQNYRNAPIGLPIPTAYFDSVLGHWQHIGLAQWDGAKFAFQMTHFCTVDANYGESGTLLVEVSKSGANPNKGNGVCAGSSWTAGGGSLRQEFALPTTHVRGEDFGVSLHYDSGLAASRTQGKAGTAQAAVPLAVGGGGGVAMGGIRVTTQCVSRGGGGGGGGSPGSCSSSGGSCSLGGGGGATFGFSSLGTVHKVDVPAVPAGAQDMDVGYFVNLPVVGDSVAGTAYVSQSLSLSLFPSAGPSTSCVSSGTFGVGNPSAASVEASLAEGPWLNLTRRVLVHHRHTSAFGAGWALREVSRVYRNDDTATLIHGDGHEEEFHPRARLAQLQGPGNYDHGIARDPVTGEIFLAQHPGDIVRLDPSTGATTSVLSGLSIGTDLFHGLAIAYVGGTRHFVVAQTSRLLDIDASGAQRTLVARPTLTDAAFNEANVAARGSAVYYTSGAATDPVVHRIKLDVATPVVESISTSIAQGDIKLFPTAPLRGVNFEGPRGLAFDADGSLYVAVPQRNVVYRVMPDVNGDIGSESVVLVALGTGSARSILGTGERGAGRGFPVSQPFRLTMGEDGVLIANVAYGLVAYDTLSREAEVLLLDNGRDELTLSLGDSGSTTFAVSKTRILATAVSGLWRLDVDLLSSDDDPTRVLSPVGTGGLQLLDTTRATTWTFDDAGRVIEQRKRTGELDMTVAYADAQSDRVTAVTDALGGATTFAYASGKLSTITDQRGRVTTVNVNGSGDLVGFTQPDGEGYVFDYDAHHMTSKTSPRGDVTAYTFGTDGTLATSVKPGGETYQLFAAYSQDATYDANAKPVHGSSYVDSHGVTHVLTLDDKGMIRTDTYLADGVTRVVENVYAPMLGPVGDPASRVNRIFRLAYQTVNGVPLSPTNLVFDALGRPVRQARFVAGSSNMLHRWHYGSDGWLAATYDGPSSVAQRFDRDASGHVTRIADVFANSSGDDEVTAPPTGRETDFTWRSDGQPAAMTTHGVTTTFAYDDAGGTSNLTGTADTLGRTTTLGYDPRGNVTSVSDGTASSSFDFDLNNRLTTSRDALGNATTFGYQNVSCGCSESDEVTSIHTPDLAAGVQWSMTYGPQGRLASVTDPHDFTETYAYEPTGELRALTDRLNRTTTTTHDSLGRVLSVVDTLGRKHQRSNPVPQAGAWVGAGLTAGSPDSTAALTGRGAGLRSGEYQIGLDAYDTEGFPAQISFYRDATFALGYTSYFDDGQRLTARADRTAEASDSAVVPSSADPGTVVHEQYGYEGTTSAPLLSSVTGPIFGTPGNAGSTITYNLEHDEVSATGFGGGLDRPATYTYTRDAGGRVTSHTNTFADPDVLTTFASTYTYYPDGRLASNGNADGGEADGLVAVPSGAVITSAAGTTLPGPPPPRANHLFTYDARGLLATQTDFDGTYRYAYDELGRSKRLEFPDGHARVQIYDDLGRITSRCYEYPADASLNRCYGAEYDAVGNPVRLIDPEGSDVYTYDALDRLTNVTRKDVGGLTVSVDDYAFNALGALSTNAGFAVDHRRPRLDGAGVADAAVPATVDGLPVALDAGGRVTSLQGIGLTWSTTGQVRHVDLPVPNKPVDFAFDAFNRRVWTHGPATISFIQDSTTPSRPIGQEVYLYEGVHRVAAVAPGLPGFPDGAVLMSFLYDGVDHPLRLSSPAIKATPEPAPPQDAQQVFFSATPVTVAYYELDLAGNVRRLRQPGGLDLGGYRYSAFGETLEDTVVLQSVNPLIQADNRTQPLRWKGMWRFDLGGGNELYDARARMWSPKLGTFLSVDEFAFHDARTTLWGWPGQNSIRWRDPSGRIGMGDSASSDRAIGSSQSWGDPGFQTGMNQGAAAGAAATVAFVTAEPFVSTSAGISLWGALAERGLAGAIITALLGGPAAATVQSASSSPSIDQAAMAEARAAAPGGQCNDVSNALIKNVGKGDLVQMVPKGDGALPTLPGVTGPQGPWSQHTAVTFADGSVLDPFRNASYPSVEAWKQDTVGSGDVLVMVNGAVQR